MRDITPLLITCKGHGTRQRVGNDENGFPKGKPRGKNPHYRAGDIAKVLVSNGKYAGPHVGRLSTKADSVVIKPFGATKQFDLTKKTTIKVIHHADGYAYVAGLGHQPFFEYFTEVVGRVI